jgi:arabinofuranosyltransferase
VKRVAWNTPGPVWQLVLAPLVLVTLPPFAVWSTSGLATMPMVCAVFAVWGLLLGDSRCCRWRLAAVVSALGVLLRADALLFLGLVHAGAFLAGSLAQQVELRRGALRSGLVTLGAFGAQTLFRTLYHGDWLPNTARVKVGVSSMTLERGLNYDVEFLLSYIAIPVMMLVALVLPGRMPRAQRLTAWSVVAATFAYGIYIGGDFMAMGRMLILALPFITVLFASSLARLCDLRARPLGIALAGLIALFCVMSSIGAGGGAYLVPEGLRARFHFRWNTPKYVSEDVQWQNMVERGLAWQRLGKALKHRTKPGESLVIGTIGGVGFYSGLHIHDTFGLTNRAGDAAKVRRKRRSPGHDRHVPIDHFLLKKPTYVGAELVPPDQRDYLLLPHLRPGHELAPLIDIRFFPLKNDERLLRLARWTGN